jgi:hypothetical protein
MTLLLRIGHASAGNFGTRDLFLLVAFISLVAEINKLDICGSNSDPKEIDNRQLGLATVAGGETSREAPHSYIMVRLSFVNAA